MAAACPRGGTAGHRQWQGRRLGSAPHRGLTGVSALERGGGQCRQSCQCWRHWPRTTHEAVLARRYARASGRAWPPRYGPERSPTVSSGSRPISLGPRRQAAIQHLVAPFAQSLTVRSEADLLRGWKSVRGEKGDLRRVVACLERTANDHCTVKNDDAVLTWIVEIAVDAKQRSERYYQTSFLANLAPCSLLDVVAILNEAAWDVPAPSPWLKFAARK